MEITRRSQLTGKTHTREVPVDKERMLKYMSGGHHIQDIFPELSRDDREFIKSGITPEEWKEYFGNGFE